MSAHAVSRRRLLQSAPAIGIVAAGCSTTANTERQNTNESNSKVQLPSYIQDNSVKPDLPGDDKGVMAGYLSYPRNPQSRTPAPGAGDTITALCGIDGGGVPPSRDRNSFWQELDKRLGAKLEFTMVPNANYVDKLQTTVAGDELPDIVALRPIPRLPGLLASRFTDLSKHLAGDAIKKYPALANIPTRSWRSCVFNGGIYGVPLNRSALFREMIVRQDIVSAMGLSTSGVTDGKTFLQLCRELTIPSKNQWAMGNLTLNLEFIKEMVGAPNVWAEADGKFTRDYETEEMKQAIDILRTMWKDGLFHPDTFGKVNIADLFGAGRVVMNNGGTGSAYQQFPTLYKPTAPNFDIGYLAPPKWDGGGLADYYLGEAIYSPVGLTKADDGRIDYLLQVMNWLASPFGTEEYLFLNYGAAGQHHTLSGTDPVKAPTGVAETALPVRYLAAAPVVIYSPGSPDDSREYHSYQTGVVPRGLESAALGLYSPTDQEKSATLYKQIVAELGDVVQGRKPMTAWDDAVKLWRSSGGDQIRNEFEQAYADANE